MCDSQVLSLYLKTATFLTSRGRLKLRTLAKLTQAPKTFGARHAAPVSRPNSLVSSFHKSWVGKEKSFLLLRFCEVLVAPYLYRGFFRGDTCLECSLSRFLLRALQHFLRVHRTAQIRFCAQIASFSPIPHALYILAPRDARNLPFIPGFPHPARFHSAPSSCFYRIKKFYIKIIR